MKTILVGVDGSPGAGVALEFAAREAAAHGATLRLVSAWELPPAALSGDSIPLNIFDGVEAEARKIVSDAAARVRELEPTVAIEERVAEGHAGSVLVGQSAEADLIVIGRRGHSGLSELLLGSISHQVADHAKCPVVIVPRGKPAE